MKKILFPLLALMALAAVAFAGMPEIPDGYVVGEGHTVDNYEVITFAAIDVPVLLSPTSEYATISIRPTAFAMWTAVGDQRIDFQGFVGTDSIFSDGVARIDTCAWVYHGLLTSASFNSVADDTVYVAELCKIPDID